MRKIGVMLVVAICFMVSSCGIFKKGCNCPHFGKAISAKFAGNNLC